VGKIVDVALYTPWPVIDTHNDNNHPAFEEADQEVADVKGDDDEDEAAMCRTKQDSLPDKTSTITQKIRVAARRVDYITKTPLNSH
jgi:hypothetical protein